MRPALSAGWLRRPVGAGGMVTAPKRGLLVDRMPDRGRSGEEPLPRRSSLGNKHAGEGAALASLQALCVWQLGSHRPGLP